MDPGEAHMEESEMKGVKERIDASRKRRDVTLMRHFEAACRKGPQNRRLPDKYLSYQHHSGHIIVF
jgi:hypothetical protein